MANVLQQLKTRHSVNALVQAETKGHKQTGLRLFRVSNKAIFHGNPAVFYPISTEVPQHF